MNQPEKEQTKVEPQQSQQPQLPKKQKPTYQKLTDIKPGKHCFHVYCKVTKLEREEKELRNGKILKIAKGKVADTSGLASF